MINEEDEGQYESTTRFKRMPTRADREAEAAEIAALRPAALAVLADAERPEYSLHKRTDLAFDAVYGLSLYFARKMGTIIGQAPNDKTPLIYAQCFLKAAPLEAFEPAIAYLAKRHSTETEVTTVTPGELEALRVLAKNIESALP